MTASHDLPRSSKIGAVQQLAIHRDRNTQIGSDADLDAVEAWSSDADQGEGIDIEIDRTGR